uniref:Uncharacterized protein n=1 Tax=Lotharella oceanica TaxID=641309 RepID=A0A7S2U5S2_9EUKA
MAMPEAKHQNLGNPCTKLQIVDSKASPGSEWSAQPHSDVKQACLKRPMAQKKIPQLVTLHTRITKGSRTPLRQYRMTRTGKNLRARTKQVCNLQHLFHRCHKENNLKACYPCMIRQRLKKAEEIG